MHFDSTILISYIHGSVFNGTHIWISLLVKRRWNVIKNAIAYVAGIFPAKHLLERSSAEKYIGVLMDNEP